MNPCMAKCVFPLALVIIRRLRWESVPNKFRVQVTRVAGRLQREAEIIHCEYILQELRLLEVSNSTRLPRCIEGMCKGIGTRIEIVIVQRFIDPDAPQHNGRMVPVSTNHSAYIVDRHLLPLLIAYMLPARDLLKHQQPDLVAAIEKVARLRIVRSSHDVTVKILAKDIRILALNACWHSLPDKRKRLMPVEATQLDDLSIQ